MTTVLRVARKYNDHELLAMAPSRLPLSYVRGSPGSIDDEAAMSPEHNARGELLGAPGSYEGIPRT